MTKSKNKFLLVLSLSGILSLVSCGQGLSTKFDVWSSYSTAKVIKETYRNEDFINTGSSINIQMMREEYESGQIIVTSKSKQYFDLVKTDLVDTATGNTIPSEKIEIYVQKYLTLDYNSHTTLDPIFDGGDSVPDMLLPLKYAIDSGENYVDANSNQGITVEVDSYDVAPGTYTGEFILKVGNKTQVVPVEVTVWDILFEGKSTIQTCWLIYSMYMLTGEYDASEHMLDTYSDFLSKYKANPYVIQEQVMNSPEALMQDVERMWDIKNYNSIIIPYDFPLSYTADSYEGQIAANYIVKIAEKSTEERFYLDYALFYPSTYDEADVIANKRAATPDFFKKGGNYDKTLERAISILENKGYFDKHDAAWNERVKTAIRNIPDVFTNCHYVEDWVKEYPATFCPRAQELNYQWKQQAYLDYANLNANGDFWTYTCCDPDYPFPSHHLDDDNLSMRVLGWQEKAFNINGYLYYMANMYTTENKSNEFTTPYETPDRNGAANGDGYIMYPGRPYGSPTPFPSTRLITYRDGLEDYDMLEVYERKISETAEKYGLENVNPKDYVYDIYSKLFTNAEPTEDHAVLYEMREELASRILELNNSDELFTTVVTKNNKPVLQIYANKPQAKIDGTTKDGVNLGNNKYLYEVTLTKDSKDINIEVVNGEKHVYRTNGMQNISNFAESTTTVTASEDTTYDVIDGKIHATIRSVEKDRNQTIRFRPSLSLHNIQLKNAKKLTFNYFNKTNKEIDFEVELLTSSRSSVVGTQFVLSNKGRTAEIDLSKTTIDLSKVVELKISFINYYFDDANNLCLFEDRDIVLEDLYATY